MSESSDKTNTHLSAGSITPHRGQLCMSDLLPPSHHHPSRDPQTRTASFIKPLLPPLLRFGIALPLVTCQFSPGRNVLPPRAVFFCQATCRMQLARHSCAKQHLNEPGYFKNAPRRLSGDYSRDNVTTWHEHVNEQTDAAEEERSRRPTL